MRLSPAWLGMAVWLVAGAALAEPPAPSSPEQALQQAEELRAKGDLDAAIDVLKQGMKSFPEHERLRHALSLAYLEDDNEFWALKVLREYEQEHPPACNTRALQAWIHIQQANMDLAEEILDIPGCDRPPQVLARHLLLRAHLQAQLDNDQEAAQLTDEAREAGRYYEEDKALLD
ncbi:MAG: tetratricopeptide repeat protein, partial [Myxococcota bacterium]